MGSSVDLSDFFHDWPYDEDQNVRFITASDGREIMQIRQPLGVEQYELDGRPDGRHPFEKDTVLDEYKNRYQTALAEGQEFDISAQDFFKLREEGILFYFRYLALFQVGQYERVAVDTQHNLEICDLVEGFYAGDDKGELLQYRPYIRRVNAIAKAMVSLADDEPANAKGELEKAYEEIETLKPVETPVFQFEKIRSLQHLKQVIDQVENASSGSSERATGLKERLENELKSAVDNENYEDAARLRDRIRHLDDFPPDISPSS